MKAFAIDIIRVLWTIFAIPLVLSGAAYVGWFFGVVMALLAGGVLSFGTAIPVIMAWAFVGFALLVLSNVVKATQTEGE